MRVVIGNRIFDSVLEPIMIVFDEGEKEMIANMGELKKFCSYPPTGFTEEIIEEFMDGVELDD